MGISVLPDFRPPRSDFRSKWSGFRPRVPEIRPTETEIRPMGLKSDPTFRWFMILWGCPKFTFSELFLDLKSFFSNFKYFLSYSKIWHICLNWWSDFRPHRSDFRPSMPGIRPLGLISVPKGLKLDPWHLKLWLTNTKLSLLDLCASWLGFSLLAQYSILGQPFFWGGNFLPKISKTHIGVPKNIKKSCVFGQKPAFFEPSKNILFWNAVNHEKVTTLFLLSFGQFWSVLDSA